MGNFYFCENSYATLHKTYSMFIRVAKCEFGNSSIESSGTTFSGFHAGSN